MTARILVVDDKPNMRSLFVKILRDLGEVVVAEGGRRALELLEKESFDLVISDIRMPEVDGEQLLRHVRSMPAPPEFILMTAYATVETAVAALRLGAYDYLTKPFDPDDARAVVERALSRRGFGEAKPMEAFRDGWHGLAGRSPKMHAVFALLDKVAATDASVLLLGESGTGKELLARAIHEASPRSAGRFVAVNCAAIPATLMESELFGYAKGAFSGAAAARGGLFEEASGGTLFLDEIGDMRRALQAKLTRALEEKAVRRIGEAQERPVDVRVISATHRNLPALVTQGAFREDLFYRLNTCMVNVPPLREREGDIPLLIDHFLEERAAQTGKSWEITPSALSALLAHSWPGNVRELRSAIERAAIVSEDGRITRAALPAEVVRELDRSAESMPDDFSDSSYREAVQRLRTEGVRKYLEAVLRRFDGNVTLAAHHADVERESFYRLCRQHGVNPNEFRSGDEEDTRED
jgi:two-component system response regulator HydG